MAKVQDVYEWLRTIGREPRETLGPDERKQLAEVLKGPLMKPVVAALADRLEGMKDAAMSLDVTKVEGLATMQALQAESRGIIVVLELMWEMTNAQA